MLLLTRSRHFEFETPIEHTILLPAESDGCVHSYLCPFGFMAFWVCGLSSLWPLWLVAKTFVAASVCGRYDQKSMHIVDIIKMRVSKCGQEIPNGR